MADLNAFVGPMELTVRLVFEAAFEPACVTSACVDVCVGAFGHLLLQPSVVETSLSAF